MTDLRRPVLYGVIALATIVLAVLKLSGYPAKMSYTAGEIPTATSTTLLIPDSSASSSSTSTPARSAFKLEVVTDAASQERGLGGRADVPANYGMLFVFSQKSRVGFWMKDMRTPIDMIWLDDDGTVLGVDASVSPASYRSATDADVFYPPAPVRYVLETRAGEARRQGWTVGTHVPFTLP